MIAASSKARALAVERTPSIGWTPVIATSLVGRVKGHAQLRGCFGGFLIEKSGRSISLEGSDSIETDRTRTGSAASRSANSGRASADCAGAGIVPVVPIAEDSATDVGTSPSSRGLADGSQGGDLGLSGLSRGCIAG